jgi:hypothetical protein
MSILERLAYRSLLNATMNDELFIGVPPPRSHWDLFFTVVEDSDT